MGTGPGPLPPRRRSAKIRKINWWRVLILLLIFAVILGTAAGAGFVFAAVKHLPNINHFEPKPSLTSIVYDAHGKELAKLHASENRIWVKLDKIPPFVQDAFIASEDHRFYEHPGFDLKGIIRALWIDLTSHELQGGSTITQQLAKNAFLSSERTISRKIQELILAVELERRYSKKEILEMYLNQIFLGQDAYGVQAAAQTYFGKNVWDLNLAEAAMLAGLTKSPNAYSPFKNFNLAQEREFQVLDQMLGYKLITKPQYDEAKKTEIKLAPAKKAPYEAAHFVDYVLQYLLNKYGEEKVYRGGLSIYTTVNLSIQKAVEASIQRVLDPIFPLKPGKVQPEAASVVIETGTGYIRAMVGRRTYTSQLEGNLAVDARRQPGSSFKPLVVYTPAIDRGFTPASVIDDSYVQFPSPQGIWAPENWDHQFHGLVTIRQAVEQSINVAAVKWLNTIGINTGIEYLKKFGIKNLELTDPKKNDYTLAIALGGITRGVSPLEMATAYSVLANQGVMIEPIAVLKVVDKDGNVLEENRPHKKLVLSPQTAYVMTDILKGVITNGTGKRANIGRPAAGKTGTTDDYADAWFIGYTPEYVSAVWMGYEKERKSMGQIGGPFAASIWSGYMREILKDKPVRDFPMPKDIITGIKICTKSGKLAGPNCPEDTIRSEIFIAGTEPKDQCDVHVRADVCADNPSLLANEKCPNKISKVFIKRPQPYVPAPDGRIPLDAAEELPTKYYEGPATTPGNATPGNGKPGTSQPEPTNGGSPPSSPPNTNSGTPPNNGSLPR